MRQTKAMGAAPVAEPAELRAGFRQALPAARRPLARGARYRAARRAARCRVARPRAWRAHAGARNARSAAPRPVRRLERRPSPSRILPSQTARAANTGQSMGDGVRLAQNRSRSRAALAIATSFCSAVRSASPIRARLLEQHFQPLGALGRREKPADRDIPHRRPVVRGYDEPFRRVALFREIGRVGKLSPGGGCGRGRYQIGGRVKPAARQPGSGHAPDLPRGGGVEQVLTGNRDPLWRLLGTTPRPARG